MNGTKSDEKISAQANAGSWTSAGIEERRMRLHDSPGLRVSNAAVAPLILMLAISASAQSGAASGASSGGAQAGWLANKTNLIAPGDLPRPLATALEQSGSRMMSAEKAQITMSGTLTDSRGARAGQLTIQAPGYLSFRDGQGRAVTFDGTGIKNKAGAADDADNAIAESLLAGFPDMVCLQVATGGSYRRIGSHFRPDGGAAKNYTGPYWTLLAFSPKARPGLAAGKALQQDLFIAIDEQTGFIAEIRSVVNKAPKQQQVTQTQFSNWSKQDDQWFPGSITRYENGLQVLSFSTTGASVGLAASATVFVP